jgi:hypothetical protein
MTADRDSPIRDYDSAIHNHDSMIPDYGTTTREYGTTTVDYDSPIETFGSAIPDLSRFTLWKWSDRRRVIKIHLDASALAIAYLRV